MISKINITIGILTILFGVGFADWQSLNGPPVGRADDMSIGWDPEWNYWVIYAADQTHKLYKSTNEGESWDSLPPPGAPPNPNIVNPTCVITRPNDAQVVYIGKNAEVPVWWSQDGGVTWEPRSGIPPYNITNTQPLCFAMNHLFPWRIYLGCKTKTNDHSLYYSPDGGYTWYGRGIQNVAVNCINVIHEVAAAESIFIATSQGIYLSTDAGANWSLRQAGNFCAISNYIDGTGTRIFYAVQCISSGGIYRSIDGTGANWDALENSPCYPVDIAIQQGISNIIYCATEYQYIYSSTDNGSSWTQINYHFCDPKVRCLLIHPANQNVIYAGTEECLYKSLDGGNTWFEKTKGFKLTDQACDLSLALPNGIFVSYEGTCSWKLENGSWTLRFAYPPSSCALPERAGANGDVLADDIDPLRVYVTSEVRMGPDADYVCRSTDGGWTWEDVTPNQLPILNQKSLALNPLYNNIIYIIAESPPQFLRSVDYGLHWELITINHNSETPRFYSIDLSNSEPQAIYLGDVIYGVAKSTDGGNNWEFYSNGLPGAKINAIAVDPNIPSIVYAGTSQGIYKSTDYGEIWHDLGLIQYPYITDIEIDPEEPTIVYTICKQHESATTSYVICSVDRGRAGFYAGQGLPDITYDIEIDRHYPEVVYCTTNRGVYTYTPDFNKHLVSSSPWATFANNGRKLLHVYATNELWVVYESGGVVYAVHSTDNGETWSRKMEIGAGYCPAIAMRDLPDYPPCVVWLAKNEQDTIYFAQYLSAEKWTDPVPIVVSESGIDFGAPSFVIGDYNLGHLVYDNGSACYYVSFNVYNPSNPGTPELIGAGISPCIGFMAGAQYPQLHVVLEDEGVIYYSTKISGSWTREVVSEDEYIEIIGCHHPSLVVEGSVVYVVWDGVLDEKRNIFWRHLTYIDGEAYWSWVWPVCWTENNSSYPVLATGYFCSWVEEQGTDYEIYHARYDPMLWTWRDQTNISNSPERYSRFSQLAHKQTEQGTQVYIIWTENSQPFFDIKFAVVSLGGGSNPDLLAGLPLYIAKGGEEVASPFNLRRQGYVQYGSMPYQCADIDEQYVEYQFDNLNPEYDYGLAACVYQHGYNKLPLTAKVDNQTMGVINLPSDTLIIRRHRVPRGLYADSVIRIRVSGNPALSALLVLYRYEKIRSGGGPQDRNTMRIGSLEPKLEIYPNPFRNHPVIKFQIPNTKFQTNSNYQISNNSEIRNSQSEISLCIYDATGRLVKSFGDIQCNAVNSVYSVLWSGDDNAGRAVPTGVYFVRLEAGDYKKVEKVILLK